MGLVSTSHALRAILSKLTNDRNMFLAAAPYLQHRFRADQSLLSTFQAAELSVSTVANLGSMFILTKLQAHARYDRRIVLSLGLNLVTFTLLAISTRVFLGVSAGGYFGFIMIMVLSSSLATGFMQNGVFSYVQSFDRAEYVNAIMVGQGVAGVSPPIVQMVSTLSGSAGGTGSSTAAFAFFLTASGVSALALLAFFYLLSRHGSDQVAARKTASLVHPDDEPPAFEEDGDEMAEAADKKEVSLFYLARRLFFPASAVFLTFSITMVFPVFTQEIFTTQPDPPPYLRDAAFIPLALLIWNAGDLLGRLLPSVPSLSLAHRPRVLFVLSISRLVFIPLYLICNIRRPQHSPDPSAAALGLAMPDFFYLAIVQFPFGLSNGFLGTCCMTGAPDCVEENERKAAGSFMSLALVGGLAFGSVCSFFVGR